ncbi:tetraspanin-CD63 receptor [Schistosoma japonicum]|nr:tetraspanin-CD63 receptor [Schistosoma japonicum]
MIQLIAMALHQLGFKNVNLAYFSIIANLLKLVSPFGTAITIIGVVCVIIGLFGICGVCMNNKKLLGIYAFFVGSIALALLITLCVLQYRIDIFTDTALILYRKGVENYQSMTSDTVDTIFTVYVSIKLNCCGENGGNDFKNAVNFNGTDAFHGVQYSGIQFPVICCQFNPKSELVDLTCPNEFTNTNSNINRGCKEPLAEVISQYSYIAVIALTSGLVLLMVILSFAVVKIRSIGDKSISVKDQIDIN